MNNQDTNNQSIIEDLAAQNAEEVKGGPRSSAVVSLGKLGRVENQAQTETDDDTLRGVTLNHNETVAADEASDNEAPATKLADLTVDEDTEAEIKGGYQYRAKRAELPTN